MLFFPPPVELDDAGDWVTENANNVAMRSETRELI
jgi:hypothetical protein